VSGPLETQAEVVPDKPRGRPPRLWPQKAAGVRSAMPQAPGALAGSKKGGAPFQERWARTARSSHLAEERSDRAGAPWTRSTARYVCRGGNSAKARLTCIERGRAPGRRRQTDG
jgi:hypothetical protein